MWILPCRYSLIIVEWGFSECLLEQAEWRIGIDCANEGEDRQLLSLVVRVVKQTNKKGCMRVLQRCLSDIQVVERAKGLTPRWV